MVEQEVKSPRLGTAGAKARPPGSREVELPDCGASLLLAKPRIGNVLDFNVTPQSTNKEGFEATIDMLVSMVVEPSLDGDDPDMSVEEFKREMHDLTVPDWQIVSNAVIELSGVSPEVVEAAKRQFQDIQRQTVPVSAGEGPGKDGEGTTE